MYNRNNLDEEKNSTGWIYTYNGNIFNWFDEKIGEYKSELKISIDKDINFERVKYERKDICNPYV